MMKRFVDLAAAHRTGKVVVFTMASSVPEETGPGLVEEFRALGAPASEFRHLTREQAREPGSAGILAGAGGVFFSGGDQSRHTAVLLDTPLHAALLEFYAGGGVVGGTSAGAAVMSEVMITGDERHKPEEGHEFETIEAGNVITARGLGFIGKAVIDQHFVRRKRHNRLLSLLAERPELLGIGIDESTAVLVEPGRTFEVIGQRSVLVFDASRARIRISPAGAVGAEGISLHILTEGQRFDLDARRILGR
jgi:cyanophycinase